MFCFACAYSFRVAYFLFVLWLKYAIFCYILTLPDEIKIIIGKMFRFLLFFFVFGIDRKMFFLFVYSEIYSFSS